MLMDKIHEVMMEYLKNVTPAQLESDLEEVGIRECPDKLTYKIQGDRILFTDQSLVSDILKVSSIPQYTTIELKPLSVDMVITTYDPQMHDSQYLFRKVA